MKQFKLLKADARVTTTKSRTQFDTSQNVTDMPQTAKQWTLWFMKSNITNGVNFLSGVYVHASVCTSMCMQIWKRENVIEKLHVFCMQ
jgi:hypothetical protein